MNKCTRNFYEESVYIRGMKLIAAENGYDALMDKITASPITKSGRAAVIGGGPAGMAAAYFLRTFRHGDYIVREDGCPWWRGAPRDP